MSLFTFCEMTLQNATFWGLGTQGAYEHSLDFLTMHLPAKFHHHISSFGSYRADIQRNKATKKQTHKQVVLLKTSTSLRYATPAEKITRLKRSGLLLGPPCLRQIINVQLVTQRRRPLRSHVVFDVLYPPGKRGLRLPSTSLISPNTTKNTAN